jgi:hypothetical protein
VAEQCAITQASEKVATTVETSELRVQIDGYIHKYIYTCARIYAREAECVMHNIDHNSKLMNNV